MLIVVEGIDAVGKDTFIDSILRPLFKGAEILHHSIPYGKETYIDIMKQCQYECSRTIIANRFMYGQFAYQQPDERKMTIEDLHECEKFSVYADMRVFWLRADMETIYTRQHKRTAEKPLCVREILRISEGFNDIFNQSTLEKGVQLMEWWNNG